MELEICREAGFEVREMCTRSRTCECFALVLAARHYETGHAGRQQLRFPIWPRNSHFVHQHSSCEIQFDRCPDDESSLREHQSEKSLIFQFEVGHVGTDDFGRMDGRNVVVTGASSGIGAAIACECARAGAQHILIHCSKSLDLAHNVAAEVAEFGAQTTVTAADFNDRQEIEKFAEEAWGSAGPVDVWINNAGVDLLTGAGRDLDYGDKLDAVYAVDVRSTALLCRAIGHRMQAAGQGCLLNIGWDQADRGMEGDSGELFSASKNAIMGMTRSLSVSLAPEVRVNCIAPGWIQTAWGENASDVWQQRVMDETPLKRWGLPADIAKMARFLSSNDAAYITGQVVNVNGGAVR